MSLANLSSPFGTPGLPPGSLPTNTPPGSIGFDPTKIAQQMQADPNVRIMMSRFFGDPASRQFVQDSGGVVSALARPDNPWTPGSPIVAAPGTSAGSQPSFSGEPSTGAQPSFASGPSGEPAFAPGASLASRAPGSAPTSAEPAPGAPQPPGMPPTCATAHDYATAHPEDVSVAPRPVAPMDNVHGARKALFLAFLGLNKFGAGLDHQQNSYADEFLGRQLNQSEAQRQYDTSQPQLKHQAEELAYNNYLGQQTKSGEIARTAQETASGTAAAGTAAQMVPYDLAIKQAQAAGADIKEQNGMLYHTSTGQPVIPNAAGVGMVPADADMAKVSGVKEGTPLPLQIAHTLKQMATEGITTTQANGRSILVDKTGKIIKDLGTATPMAVVNANLGAYGNVQSPEMQTMIDAIGSGKMDLGTALARTPPAARANLTNALWQKYPDYKQSTFDVAKKASEYFTSGEGGKNVNAFNTATEHLAQLSTLADGLQNGDTQLINKASNAWKTATGEAAPTNFEMVKNAVSGEIAKTFKGSATEGEIGAINETLSKAMSPAQLKGAIDQAKTLMQSKLHANLQQYMDAEQGKPAFAQQPGGDQQQKVATTQHVADYAKKKGITVEAATEEFKGQGYKIQ